MFANFYLNPLDHHIKHRLGVRYYGRYVDDMVCVHRKYIAARTKGNFHQAIIRQNALAKDHKQDKEERSRFISVMNSYLGILRHYNTHRLQC